MIQHRINPTFVTGDLQDQCSSESFFTALKCQAYEAGCPASGLRSNLSTKGSLKDGKMEIVYSGNQDGNLATHESEWKLRDLVYAKRKAKGNSWNNSFVWCFSVIYLFSWSVQFVFLRE